MVMKKLVKKRTFKGAWDNVFTSPYMPSFKWGAIVLVEPTETHLGGVNYRVFKTKTEGENWEPKYPCESFENFEDAKEFFEAYKF